MGALHQQHRSEGMCETAQPNKLCKACMRCSGTHHNEYGCDQVMIGRPVAPKHAVQCLFGQFAWGAE